MKPIALQVCWIMAEVSTRNVSCIPNGEDLIGRDITISVEEVGGSRIH